MNYGGGYGKWQFEQAMAASQWIPPTDDERRLFMEAARHCGTGGVSGLCNRYCFWCNDHGPHDPVCYCTERPKEKVRAVGRYGACDDVCLRDIGGMSNGVACNKPTRARRKLLMEHRPRSIHANQGRRDRPAPGGTTTDAHGRTVRAGGAAVRTMSHDRLVRAVVRRLDTKEDHEAAERLRIRRAISPHLRTLRAHGCSRVVHGECETCAAMDAIDAATRAPRKGRR